MIRRKGPILAAAVIAAFALGWYRGLFGVDATAPTAVPDAEKQAPAGARTPSAQADATSGNPLQTDAMAGKPAEEVTSGQSAEGAMSAEPAANAVTEKAAENAVPGKPAEGSASDKPAETSNDAPESAAVALPIPIAPSGAAETGAEASVEPTPAPPAPGFDVVRVEPDGSTVVAGRGAANERIVLTDGTRTFGETKTDANGDFVMSLSLPTGSHRLQLAQRDDVVSDDAAVVNVPARERPDQLLVMMQRPGEASEVLQRPAVAPTEPAAIAGAAAPVVPGSSEPQVAVLAPDEVSPTPAETPRETTAVDSAVSVEAVEIEGDRLFVAGSAKGKASVRIYLDDTFVAESRGGDGDRFIASAKADVAVGDHTIRADALDASGQVVGRVEVPFQRPAGTSMAAVAPAPDAQAPAAAPQPSTAVAAAADPTRATSDTGSMTPPTTAPPPAPAAIAAAPAGPVASSPETAAAALAPAPATGSSEPQVVKQAPLQAAASRVIIRRGDTLWRISRATYGRGSRYTVIYLANGDQIRDPDRIYPGQVFRMPSAADAAAPTRG